LSQGFASDVDGAATSDKQQPQRLSTLARSRQRKRVAGECRPRRARRVECVILAAQPTLGSRCTADLEHRFAMLGEIAGKTGAVAAGALDRPGASARRVAIRETKRLPVAAPVRSNRLPGQDSTCRCYQHCHDVLITVRVDTDHVVQLICKHPTRSSDLARRVRWCRSDAGKPRRQDGNESRRDGGQAPDQASSGRQTGAAAHTRTVHSKGTHEAASHPTSHTRHGDNQAGSGPRWTDPASLTVTRRVIAFGSGHAFVSACGIVKLDTNAGEPSLTPLL
jgi:hypothetical protein